MPRLSWDDQNLLLDGEKFQLVSGSVSYFRIFPEQWRDVLTKLRALGGNAVEVYVPWNFHEKLPGQFDFSSERRDLASFLRLAKDAGLLVLLRPGPFICAEWAMGGLPWWLLKEPGMRLRCSHDGYMRAVERYFRRLADEVRPFLGSNGGPIVAAQVENEFGYRGADPAYLSWLQGLARDVLSPDLLFFTVDGTWTPETQRFGGLDGALRTASFGTGAGDIAERLAKLREAQPRGPLICMEFWVGWFSTWGGRREERSAEAVARDLEELLSAGASVNIFVFAGGTSFGFWAGANLEGGADRLEPHITSYEYDGLLAEDGALTEKFHACRRVIAARLREAAAAAPLPQGLLKPPRAISPRTIALTQSAPLRSLLPQLATGAVSSPGPLAIEMLDEGLGYVHYRFEGPALALASLAEVPLKLYGLRDFALVLADGELLGVWDRSEAKPALQLPKKAKSLEVLVEVTARPNFGPGISEQKGLFGRVAAGPTPHDERELLGWRSTALPMHGEQLRRLNWSSARSGGRGGAGGCGESGPCFYRGSFPVAPNDAGAAAAWLRLPDFTRGFAAINGFNLGWHRREGPQLSLYVPPALLKPGDNEVVAFELLAPPREPRALLEAAPRWGGAGVANVLPLGLLRLSGLDLRTHGLATLLAVLVLIMAVALSLGRSLVARKLRRC